MKNFFYKTAEKFKVFMVGRYGIDQLYKALIIFYLVAILLSSIVARFTRIGYYVFFAISIMLLIFTFYRVFSKNIEMRRKENQDWLKITGKFKKSYNLTKDKWKYRKTHIFRKCPNCKSLLRLPKKKGSHAVTCPHCKKSFKVKVL